MKKTILALLVLSLFPGCHPQASPEPADLVLLGGSIITLNEDLPAAEALAIRGQKILAVGSEESIRPLIGKATRIYKLGRKVAYPGFFDAHAHFLGVGKAKMQLVLGSVSSWDEIVGKVAATAAQTRPGDWIEGRGWHQEKWESIPQGSFNGLPANNALNRVAPKNPVFLTHASGHMVIVNQKALEIAGITERTPDPEGGEILRDKHGRATGVLLENAVSLVRRLMPPENSRDVFLKKVELASDECLSKGLTSFEDAGSSLEEAAWFRELAENGGLRLRLNLMLSDNNEKLREKLDAMRLIEGGNHYLCIRAIKRWLDGALGSHGAWLMEPYSDLPSSSGLNTQSLESMEETARLALEHGYQLCVHAIGDRANHETLDLYEKTLGMDSKSRDLRWRIEHAQHLLPEDVSRFSRLGIIASMQPTHCTSDGPWVPQRLGLERATKESYLWRSLLDSGAHIASGTDAPVEDVDPLRTFFSAFSRRMKNGGRFTPEQAMTRMEALRSMTIEAAYASFQEEEKGSLIPGKLADLTILSGNILEVPEQELKNIHVEATIVGGKIRYELH